MVSIPEAQATLDELIGLARKGEEVVLLADDGTPLATLQPVAVARPLTPSGMVEFQ